MSQISVIVPVYKVEDYLERCVQSVLNQTFKDFELILVDDGSPDRCGTMCDEFAKMDERIRVFHKENGGQASARNLAIDWVQQNSDSQWIAFVDSDDWIHREYLNILLTAAKMQNARISICNFVCTDVYFADMIIESPISILQNSEQALVNYYSLCMSPCCKIYDRTLFSRLRFPEGKLYEDGFITHIPVLESERIAVVDEKLYYYFNNQGSTTRSKWTPKHFDQIEAHETRLAYCEKYGNEAIYKKELEAYVVAIFDQAGKLRLLRKKDNSYVKYLKELRPKLLPSLRLARKWGLIPFNRDNIWIYELAYPIKPIWIARNLLVKAFKK